MMNPHLSLEHFLRQVELHGRNRRKKELPSWLTNLLDQLADEFDPEDPVARLGYVCEPEAAGWRVTLFLSRTEVVGGAADGLARCVGYELDVSRTIEKFDNVDKIRWRSMPGKDCAAGDNGYLEIVGKIGGYDLILQVLERAPDDLAPAIKLLRDGSVKLV